MRNEIVVALMALAGAASAGVDVSVGYGRTVGTFRPALFSAGFAAWMLTFTL